MASPDQTTKKKDKGQTDASQQPRLGARATLSTPGALTSGAKAKRVGAIALRVVEGLFWLYLSGGIGDLFLSALGRDGGTSSGSSFIYFITHPSPDSLSSVLSQGLSAGQILGICIVLIVSWGLGDLPVFALSKASLQRQEEEGRPWPKDPKDLAPRVVREFEERADKSLRTAKAILMLMVATLVVGMWVFVAAPGAESARAAAAKRAAADLASLGNDISMYSNSFRKDFLKSQDDQFKALGDAIASKAVLPEFADKYEAAVASAADSRKEFLDALDAAQKTVTDSSNTLTTAIANQQPEQINSQSTLTRIGSVVILLVALKVLGSLYRSSIRLSQQYSATADALTLALQRGATTLDDDVILATIVKLTPAAEPALDIVTPMDAASKLTERLSDLASKATETAKHLAEVAKNLKSPGS